MSAHQQWLRPGHIFRGAALFSAAALCASGCFAPLRAASLGNRSGSSAVSSKDDKAASTPMTKLHLRVLDNAGKPVGNASVYVRFYQEGGTFIHHHDQLAELDLKSNQDGTVKVPPIPQGKILIQVIATGWHTFGKWYDIEKAEQTIEIKLDPPPHWY
jgi:hypothetical protein